MRTIKFLGFAVALAAVSVTAGAQAGPPKSAFPGFDEYVRLEARHLRPMQGGQRMGRFARPGMRQGGAVGQRMGRFAGPGVQHGARVGGQRFGARPGMQAGFRAGFRAGLRADATPEQKAFAGQLKAERQAVRAQVVAGKLTREQARAQMRQWATEHRPGK